MVETSPHAWSRSTGKVGEYDMMRNISTCVEQIPRLLMSASRAWKHLHMRGADYSPSPSFKAFTETSPHAWSRYIHRPRMGRCGGNISTCVEQILPTSGRRTSSEKHLHMRGADLVAIVWPPTNGETSPHAWSRFSGWWRSRTMDRNISTCVEQMTKRRRRSSWRQKHLHMRGADIMSGISRVAVRETSPHAWSR